MSDQPKVEKCKTCPAFTPVGVYDSHGHCTASSPLAGRHAEEAFPVVWSTQHCMQHPKNQHLMLGDVYIEL